MLAAAFKHIGRFQLLAVNDFLDRLLSEDRPAVQILSAVWAVRELCISSWHAAPSRGQNAIEFG